MQNDKFLPEGALIHTHQNLKHAESLDSLYAAMENEVVLEGEVTLCDTGHNLTVRIGEFCGIIPHSETAIGIDDGSTREIAIISRVGKPVSFTVIGIDKNGNDIKLLFSRKKAQKKALAHFLRELCPGDVIPAKITHLEPFGAFVDIGCGIISLIGIETISVSRISHPRDRFRVGDDIFAVVTGVDYEKQRISLSHRELLGTWSQNAAKFTVGETVCGTVRGIEDYGIFIELAPNLSGLAEWREGISEGSSVSVFVKSIIPDKMKIKLIVIDVFSKSQAKHVSQTDYFIRDGHIDSWQYSPDGCSRKKVISEFHKDN